MVYPGIRSFVSLLSSVSIVRATIAQIEAQLDSVINNSTNWEQLLDEFPTAGASVFEALAIHSAAESFSESLSTMATVTTENAFFLSNIGAATNVFDIVLSCWTGLENGLSVIVVKKPSFNTVPPDGAFITVVLNDLNNLNTSSIAFADSFIAVAPESLLPNATALKDAVLTAFATAIDAY